MKIAVLLFLVAAIAYMAAVVLLNRATTPQRGALEVVRAGELAPAGSSISVLNWNLGYAGLGKDADFVADGGTSYRFSSRELVEQNLAGIERTLRAHPADVLILQEVTRISALNHGVLMWSRLSAENASADRVFMYDVATRLLPVPLRLEHGAAVFSQRRISSAERVPLPLEPEFILGFFRKQYSLLVTRLPAEGGGEWVIVDVHLSAFDKGADIRRQQLQAALAFAEKEFAKGNRVVLSGDWNLILGGRQFPHRTDAKFLDWLSPFPPDALPAGWRLGFDPDVPSVRTLHRRYTAGDNYVSIIDGFIVSPNVEIEEVKTIDLGFEFSDHQPIAARFRAKP